MRKKLASSRGKNQVPRHSSQTRARSSFRTENDSLGPIEIPALALYGAETARAIENFPISGRTAHPAMIRAYLRIKSAAASANFYCKVITKREMQLIQIAIQEILRLNEKNWPELFPVDPYQAGAGTSQNMNLNEVIANIANRNAKKPLGSYSPIHPHDQVNRSQSTNDTFPTAMRLAILETSKALITELKELSVSFFKKARKWESIPKSARTHLQDAVPMMLGQEFSAYGATLSQCAHWIQASQDPLRELGIGGSAAGTGLTVPGAFSTKIRAELQLLCNEKLRISKNLFQSMQSQAPITYYSSALRVTALELTRICNDLRLLASGPLTGLSEIFLPAVQPGSSIMPGKVNPSILEMANQTWYSILGYDQTIAWAIQAGQLELNVMMPIMSYSVLEATQIFTHTLKILRTRCIDGLEPNIARLRNYFESTPQMATALSPKLGYQKTAELVKEALKEEKSIIELVRKHKLLTENEIRLLLDARALTGFKPIDFS